MSKIIFATAYNDAATRDRALRAGAFDVLDKPINDVVLLERIERAIAGHGQ
jgi:FixJ family two-component response regulator